MHPIPNQTSSTRKITMSTPIQGKPLQGAAHETMKRKIDLILSMVGNDTDNALTAMTYALATLTIKEQISLPSLLMNLLAIYDQLDKLTSTEGDDE